MESVWFATHPSSSRPRGELVPDDRFDTVVAGAGLTGLVTAVLLARSGQRVVVLEARHVGAVTTGNTTAKLSLLQGGSLSGIRAHHPGEVLKAYVEAQREGQAWLTRLMDDRGVPYQRRDAFTYAQSDAGVAALRTEAEASEAAGLAVSWTGETGLPFPATAIMLPNQVQLHPLLVLDALLAELEAHGGSVVEGVRVTNADPGSSGVTVTTDRAVLTADRLVLATGTPILDRGGHFARLEPLRSYATTYRVPGAPASIPAGMYLSLDDPTRSLRTVPVDGDELLMVGGNGHTTGRSRSEAAAVADLEDWTAEHFPGAERVHAWSAQDYRSVDRLPFVGPLALAGGRVFVATGYNKWGMTNAVAAALTLSARILGGSVGWADTLHRRGPSPADALSTVSVNAQVAGALARDWVQAELKPLPRHAPPEGQGKVGRGARGLPEGVATVDGVTCRVAANCTHLGGVVHWNDAEKSWDCPLHGSRFAPDGTVLEGPATRNLPVRDGA